MAFPRKPPELKVISGSRQPEPHTSSEPPATDLLTQVPAAPEYLLGDSLLEWNRAAPILVARGLLDELRVPVLAMYCAIMGKCQMKLKAGDVPTAHMVQQCRTLARELGITGPTAGPKGPDDDGNKPSRWSRLKDRATRAT
jgi:hypothetical protein